ncbi:PAP2 superfamily protein [Actinopolyspora lacussalsi subsp. righensis]|uniref:PAP2 superfamily protein n=1 Tax=Actinopolyspora righensis TaxID=995060 RepID=A0A1I6Y0E2_9ACTN|nr:phosphatase PAP2 family protein [Actinopolyspora righensis]SFT43802.1 PAP2 superfamily protein [Actinopolyspora righensis]
MSTRETSSQAERKHLLARVVTEVLAPWVIVLVLPLVVAGQATAEFGSTLLWGMVVALTSSVLPMGVVVWGSRTGRWDGHHVRDRQGRLIPFTALIVLSLLGLALLIAGRAPEKLIALDISMIISLLVTGTITVFWKISMHTAVAAGAVTVLALLYGPALWWGALVTLAVAWSRVAVDDHTPAQVTVGALTGAVIGGGSFALLLGGNTAL